MSSRARPDLVQPILVPRQGQHEELIRAVAIASHLAYLAGPEDPRWKQWLDSAPAKSVRRIKAPSHLEQALEWAREHEAPHVLHDGVLSLVPMAYDDMPRRVRGSQVNGVDYPRSEGGAPAADVQVTLLEDLTTGKAAAQAAHAVWAWALEYPEWDPLTGIDLYFTDAPGLAQAAATGESAIRDGGFTEVEPGTLTAVVNRVRPPS